MQWPNGQKYVGSWKMGLQHGQGHFSTPEPLGFFSLGVASESNRKAEVKGSTTSSALCDTEYSGTWQEGKMHGYGIMRYPNGDVYEGQFVKGQRQGHGILRQGSLSGWFLDHEGKGSGQGPHTFYALWVARADGEWPPVGCV
jgi:hypothetical protein